MVNEGKDGKWHMLKAFLKLHHEQWQQLEVSKKKNLMEYLSFF